jgi:hypothetical protein
MTDALHEDHSSLLIISRSATSILQMKNVSGKSCRETRNTPFVFNNFSPENCAYETIWKNGVQPDRPSKIHGACELDAGHLRLQTQHRLCNILCFSTATMVAQTRHNVTLYVYWLSCSSCIQIWQRSSLLQLYVSLLPKTDINVKD